MAKKRIKLEDWFLECITIETSTGARKIWTGKKWDDYFKLVEEQYQGQTDDLRVSAHLSWGNWTTKRLIMNGKYNNFYNAYYSKQIEDLKTIEPKKGTLKNEKWIGEF